MKQFEIAIREAGKSNSKWLAKANLSESELAEVVNECEDNRYCNTKEKILNMLVEAGLAKRDFYVTIVATVSANSEEAVEATVHRFLQKGKSVSSYDIESVERA